MRFLPLFLFAAFACLSLLGISGCSGGIHTRVHPLTPQIFIPHFPGLVIAEWERPPSQPFIALTKITGNGAPEADDEILAQILDQAR